MKINVYIVLFVRQTQYHVSYDRRLVKFQQLLTHVLQISKRYLMFMKSFSSKETDRLFVESDVLL